MGPSLYPWGPGAEPRHDDKRRSHVLGQFPQGRPTPSPYQTITPSTSHPNSSAALGAPSLPCPRSRTSLAYSGNSDVLHNRGDSSLEMPAACWTVPRLLNESLRLALERAGEFSHSLQGCPVQRPMAMSPRSPVRRPETGRAGRKLGVWPEPVELGKFRCEKQAHESLRPKGSALVQAHGHEKPGRPECRLRTSCRAVRYRTPHKLD